MAASLLEKAARAAGAEAVYSSFSPAQLEALKYTWEACARAEQLAPPGNWRTWLVCAGRGFGKTRLGAEWVRQQVESGAACRIALVAPTAADARDVMVEGESGILAISPPWNRPLYEPSKRRLTWPNGAIATTYSADQPERLRGPQHDAAWADEAGSWRYPDAWDMLQFGLRLGSNPLVVVTTTPKPVKLVRTLLTASTTAVTRGSTYDNAANLAPAFLEAIKAKYEGTRLGRQEIFAELLDDYPGALWQRANIDANRVKEVYLHDLVRVVVAIDPAVTSNEHSDETGIIVAGKGADGHAYILEDLSGRLSPDAWARRAVGAYYHYHADRIIAEVNQGGDLVERTIKTVDSKINYKAVRASRGKMVRAEPVAALYEQNKVKHVGNFDLLEDQQCTFTPDKTMHQADDEEETQRSGSPDRVDALVWALTELMLKPSSPSFEALDDVVMPKRRI